MYDNKFLDVVVCCTILWALCCTSFSTLCVLGSTGFLDHLFLVLSCPRYPAWQGAGKGDGRGLEDLRAGLGRRLGWKGERGEGREMERE